MRPPPSPIAKEIQGLIVDKNNEPLKSWKTKNGSINSNPDTISSACQKFGLFLAH